LSVFAGGFTVTSAGLHRRRRTRCPRPARKAGGALTRGRRTGSRWHALSAARDRPAVRHRPARRAIDRV